MTTSSGGTDPFDEITLITEPTREQLTERQLLDYRTEREDSLDWLLKFGKNPDRAEGYAVSTVSNRAYRMDQFYRWVWDDRGEYTSSVTTDDADRYLKHLARQDTTNEHKDTCRKALMMLYSWRHHQRGEDNWEPSIRFTRRNQSTTPRDYLTDTEQYLIEHVLHGLGYTDPTSTAYDGSGPHFVRQLTTFRSVESQRPDYLLKQVDDTLVCILEAKAANRKRSEQQRATSAIISK